MNSQNMVLLSASLAPHVALASTTEEVVIVGDHALLADAGPIGALPDADHHMEAEGQISIYVVRAGDSLGSIATMFGVSVNTIVWANDLERNAKIAPGATLVILPVSGVRYVVKKSDTVMSIAKKFKGDEEEIRSYNGLESDAVLAVGTEIIIPDGEIAPVVATPKRTVSTATSRLRGASGPALEGYYRAPMSNYRRSQGLHGYNGPMMVQVHSSWLPPPEKSLSQSKGVSPVDVTVVMEITWSFAIQTELKHCTRTSSPMQCLRVYMLHKDSSSGTWATLVVRLDTIFTSRFVVHVIRSRSW
jgi:LysM repeat protein